MKTLPLILIGFIFPFLLAGCTQKREPLALGKPAMPALAKEKGQVEEILINARLPGFAAWRARVTRSKDGAWMLSERSDQLGSVDLADSALIAHLLDLLSTFTTSEKAASSSDSVQGFTPFRAEIRLRSHREGKKTEETLQFADMANGTDIFFRREKDSSTWIGRGGLILFLSSLKSPEFLQWKMPYLGAYEDISGVELEKLHPPFAGKWSFKRDKNNGAWAYGESLRGMERDEGAKIERILRQRFTHLIRDSLIQESLIQDSVNERNSDNIHAKNAAPTPDWKIQVQTEGAPQVIEVYFTLNGTYARNSARSSSMMELYPEFAGALRAFIHAGFTPVKSRTK